MILITYTTVSMNKLHGLNFNEINVYVYFAKYRYTLKIESPNLKLWSLKLKVNNLIKVSIHYKCRIFLFLFFLLITFQVIDLDILWLYKWSTSYSNFFFEIIHIVNVCTNIISFSWWRKMPKTILGYTGILASIIKMHSLRT